MILGYSTMSNYLSLTQTIIKIESYLIMLIRLGFMNKILDHDSSFENLLGISLVKQNYHK